MAKPKVLETLDNHIGSLDNPHAIMDWTSVDDEENLGNTLPVNADTLEGHPASYFASASSVAQTLSSYITTVLGSSY